jgi:hypothetical protein
VAYVDPTRTRFRLTDMELAAAGLAAGYSAGAASATPETAEALSALSAAGLYNDDTIDPQLELLVETLTASFVDIAIEVVGLGRATHLAWTTDGLAVVGIDVGEDQREYLIVDPVLLPWTLATAIGLGARRTDAPRTVMELPSSTLDWVIECLALADHATIETRLTEELDASVAEQLLGVLGSWRASWRASSRLTRESEPDVAAQIAIIDTDLAGYWRTQATTDSDLGATVTLAPIAPSEVWEYLQRLIPGLVEEGMFGFPPIVTSTDLR